MFIYNLTKKISIFLIIIFSINIIISTPITTKAETLSNIKYSISGEPKVGNTIEIAINVSSVSDLYGGSIDFLYDTNIIEVQSITKGAIFGNAEVLTPLGVSGKINSGQASFAILMKGNKSGVSNNGTLAIIKAKVIKEGTINLKTTDSNTSLILNGFTTRIKLSNSLGKKITYNAEDKSIKLTYNNPTIESLLSGTYEENNENLTYKGTWLNDSNAKHSSSNLKYSSVSGNSIEFKFIGTGLNLYAFSNKYRGIAKIYIDDVLYTSDGYSATDVYKNKVFSKGGLSNTTHNVKIVVDNNKNANSFGISFALDYIEVLGVTSNPLTVGLHEENNENLTYKGTWLNDSNAKHSSSNLKYSSVSGDSIEFSFTGTGVNLYAFSNQYRGIAKIYIDDILYTSDGYSATNVYKNKVFSKGGLTNTTHNVKIVVDNNKNANSFGISFALDYIEVLGVTSNPLTVGLHEENNENLTYKGTWLNDSNAKHSSSNLKYSSVSGDSIEFSFTGTGVNLYAFSNQYRGIAKIYIDDILYTSDGYSATNVYKNKVFSKGGLTNTTHNVKIVVDNNKNANSFGISFALDYIEVLEGTSKTLTVGIHEENNENLTYKGTWLNDSNAKHSSSNLKYSSVSGDSIEFSFTGTGVNLYAFSNQYRGIAKIYIDDILYTSDGYSATNVYKNKVFSKGGLTNTTHNVKIVVDNNKNANSFGISFALDYIEVLEGTSKTLTVGLYEENNENLTYKGTWLNDSNPKHSSSNLKYSSVSGDSIEFSFTGTGLNLYAFSNQYRGIAKIYIDDILYTSDGYSATNVYKNKVFSKGGLSNTTHNVKIVVDNNKNANSFGISFALDYIEVLN